MRETMRGTLLFIRPVRLPQSFWRVSLRAGPTAPDEEGIAEPVEILHGLRGNLLGASQCDQPPLRAPADSPAYVQFGIQPGAARQHERAQLSQAFVHAIHFRLQPVDVALGHARLPWMNVFG